MTLSRFEIDSVFLLLNAVSVLGMCRVQAGFGVM
jgi:hypothetical protein